jgi:hypothetical protein
MARGIESMLPSRSQRIGREKCRRDDKRLFRETAGEWLYNETKSRGGNDVRRRVARKAFDTGYFEIVVD